MNDCTDFNLTLSPFFKTLNILKLVNLKFKRYFIQLSYNGTAYSGWQVQKNSKYTVQQTLNEMLSRLLNESINIMGCGRTDTGVHAKKYFAHFDTTKEDLIENHDHWILKFNHALPKDIAIQKIFKVQVNASARYDAYRRTYQYVITKKKDPFEIDKAYFLYGKLDVKAMNKASQLLFEYDDFSAFAKSNTQNKTNICKLYKAEWKEDENSIVFTISANRFLRDMVRAIVGTILKVGKGKITFEEFRKVIESKTRSNAGLSVPACGLFLVNVEYKKGLLDAVEE